MNTEGNLWELLELDKERVIGIVHSLEEYSDTALKWPKKSVHELAKKLEGYNLREISFALIHLDIMNKRSKKRGDVAARLLIDDENNMLVDNILSFFDSIDELRYGDYEEEHNNEE